MSAENLDTLVNLLMLLALVVGIFLWWAVKHGGQRGRIAERTRQAAAQQSDEDALNDSDGKNGVKAWLVHYLARFGDRLPLFDAKYRIKLHKEMIRSGYRSQSAVSVLLAIKFIVGLIAAAFTVMFDSHIPVIGQHSAARGAMMLVVFVVGMIVPEYVLAFFASRRRQTMASCLPDAIDLLVICTNAGNSLSVSVRRVAQEMENICPPLADELGLAADEMNLSGDSGRALQALGDRVDLPSVAALVSTLTQSMRYGTPITQALRTVAQAERLAHMVALEEKAAKLAPKITVPMMLFILPSVMLVAGGPAVIQLMSVFAKK